MNLVVLSRGDDFVKARLESRSVLPNKLDLNDHDDVGLIAFFCIAHDLLFYFSRDFLQK